MKSPDGLLGNQAFTGICALYSAIFISLSVFLDRYPKRTKPM